MTICPFCGHDPYHYVDNGIGMEAVAVTCCELGIVLFDRREKPETVTLSWEEFEQITTKLFQRQHMMTTLEQCEEYFDGQSDVKDGEYGVPEPNTEMRLLSEVRDAISNR